MVVGTASRGLAGRPSSLYGVPNVTAHPSTASVPITVLLYNGPLLRGFNVPLKGHLSCRYDEMATYSVTLHYSVQ